MLKGAHLICRRTTDRPGLTGLTYDKTNKVWHSGDWDIPVAEAESLIGGRLFLHEAKAEPSVLGGRVLAVVPVTRDCYPHAERVVFIVEARADGKGRAWHGRGHAMAHYSGIVDMN